jgi:hypothetical protein
MHERGPRKGILLVAGGVLVLFICWAFMLLLLDFALIHPWRNTEYAPAYSARGFRAVAYGDPEQRVLDLLGEPLERNLVPEYPAYVYLRYSRAIGPSETHLARIILLVDGHVTRKWHELYRD